MLPYIKYFVKYFVKHDFTCRYQESYATIELHQKGQDFSKSFRCPKKAFAIQTCRNIFMAVSPMRFQLMKLNKREADAYDCVMLTRCR